MLLASRSNAGPLPVNMNVSSDLLYLPSTDMFEGRIIGITTLVTPDAHRAINPQDDTMTLETGSEVVRCAVVRGDAQLMRE